MYNLIKPDNFNTFHIFYNTRIKKNSILDLILLKMMTQISSVILYIPICTRSSLNISLSLIIGRTQFCLSVFVAVCKLTWKHCNFPGLTLTLWCTEEVGLRITSTSQSSAPMQEWTTTFIFPFPERTREQADWLPGHY